MMPLSYQSIGFTFIFLMVVVLVIAEAFRYIKARVSRPRHESHISKKEVGRNSIG
jgi:hypothetical protein